MNARTEQPGEPGEAESRVVDVDGAIDAYVRGDMPAIVNFLFGFGHKKEEPTTRQAEQLLTGQEEV